MRLKHWRCCRDKHMGKIRGRYRAIQYWQDYEIKFHKTAQLYTSGPTDLSSVCIFLDNPFPDTDISIFPKSRRPLLPYIIYNACAVSAPPTPVVTGGNATLTSPSPISTLFTTVSPNPSTSSFSIRLGRDGNRSGKTRSIQTSDNHCVRLLTAFNIFAARMNSPRISKRPWWFTVRATLWDNSKGSSIAIK